MSLYRNGEILAECGEDGEPVSRYVYGSGLSHVQTLRDGVYHAYHRDEQGSTAYMTGPGGGVENSYRYDAFGNLLERKETVPNRILYTGQQYDQETGQYYLRARYYNPVVGRFLQEDTYHGDGLNLYAYCANNPVVYYDPGGHDSAAVMKKAEEPDLPVGVGKGGSVTLQTGGRKIDYNAYIKRLETIDMEYENIRINTTDISKIAQNTGMPKWKISRIKEHVFSNEHILDSGVKRFDTDPEIADAWYRLTNGTFNQNDIDLLNHEYFESKFESFYKTDYRTAHNKTEESGRIWDPYKEDN